MHCHKINMMCSWLAPLRHHPLHLLFHSCLWTCCYSTVQTGHLPAGGVCFFLSWKGTSPFHSSFIWLRSMTLSRLLFCYQSSATSLLWTLTVPICCSDGQRWASTPDNKVVFIGTKKFPYSHWTGWSFCWWSLPSAAVCPHGHQAVIQLCFHTAPSSYYSSNLVSTERAAVEAESNQNYVMLWAACCMGLSGFMKAEEFTVTHQGEFDLSASLCFRDIAMTITRTPQLSKWCWGNARRISSAKVSAYTWAEQMWICATLAYSPNG